MLHKVGDCFKCVRDDGEYLIITIKRIKRNNEYVVKVIKQTDDDPIRLLNVFYITNGEDLKRFIKMSNEEKMALLL